MADFRDKLDFSDVWLSALDGGRIGLWDRDVVADEIRYSRSWNMILGYEKLGSFCPLQDSYERVHPEDLPHIKSEIQRHFEQKTCFYEAEYRIRCQNGEYKWVLSRGKVIERDHAGNPLRMVGTTTDVTHIRVLNEKLLTQQRLAQSDAERLAALAYELAERSNELAAAHRIARIGAWRWDLSRRFLTFSPEVWKLMGHEPSNLPVTYDRLRTMFHPDDYDLAMSGFYKAVRDRSPISQEYRIVQPDGSIRNMLTHAELVIGPAGDVLRMDGTTQDITSYRTMETALKESEDHYRHMVDLHPQIPWLADPLGNIIEVGPLWFKLTGLTREMTLPRGWLDAVHDEDRPQVVAVWSESLSNGEVLDIEYRVRLVDGQYGWFRARAAARLDGRGQVLRWYGTLEDVTDRRLAEERRRASEALALRVLSSTGDGVLVSDRRGMIKFANERAEKLIGGPINIIGSNIAIIFAGGHGHRISVAIDSVQQGETVDRFEVFWAPLGAWYEINIYPGSDDISIFIRDISDKIISRKKIAYAANHDLLTGALNRSVFFDRVKEYLADQRPGDRVALHSLDLDYFKEINDTYGHPVGDQLLKLLVGRLKNCLRGKDLLARCGGDEFAILQTGITTPNDAVVLAERIIVAMRAPFQIEGIQLSGTLSIGVSVANIGFLDADLLYKQADLALYEAKNLARGSCELFRPELQIHYDHVKRMRSELAQAIGRGEFRLAFQPIVRVTDLAIIGVEALLRWHHPERGLISPSEFIPIAEESGLIVSIGEWVIREACRSAGCWPADVKISVNVSVRQLEKSNFEEILRCALTETGLRTNRLKLEVTESVLMSNNRSCIEVLQRVQELGVSIAIDDFGTGYSSLSYMNVFKFDDIKIDRSFISAISLSDDREPIFEAIMGMAHAMKIPVTVEGVETSCQFSYVKNLRCDFVQGYLIAAPMGASDMYRFVSTTDHINLIDVISSE